MAIKLKHYLTVALVLMILVIIGVIVFWTTGPHFPKQTKQDKQFEKALKKAIKSGAKEVYLKDLTDFEWERVYCLAPYGVETFNGIKWTGLSCFEYGAIDESHWGLLFVDSNKNTIPICIKRGIIDYSRESQGCVVKDGTKGMFTEENWGTKDYTAKKVLRIKGQYGQPCQDYLKQRERYLEKLKSKTQEKGGVK
jgi:hypothetical protein